MHQVIGHLTNHGSVIDQLMIPSSNKTPKHVGFDMWNMCDVYVILSRGYVSRLSTSFEGGPSGRSRENMVHSASITLDKVFICSASPGTSSMAVALCMPMSNQSNCRCTFKSCITCKKPNQVHQLRHTKDVSESVAGALQGCFKLMVSTSESDLYMSSPLKDLISDVELSNRL